MAGYSSEVLPCAELFREMSAKLTDDDFYQIKMLSKDKLDVSDIEGVKDWNNFFAILHDKFSNRPTKLLKFLRNVAEHTENCIEPSRERPSWENLKDIISHQLEKFKTIKKEMRQHGISRGANFVGRKEEIKKIDSFLREKSSKIQGVCICGMGGMGKTSMAAEVCYSVRYTSDVLVKKTLSLRGQSTVADFYHSVLNGLSDDTQAYRSQQHTEDDLKNAVREKLKDLQRDVILFLDNLDDVSRDLNFLNALRELLQMKTDKQVKLLITCRKKLADCDDEPGDSVYTTRLDGNILEVTLGRLSIEDGKVLLKHCAGQVQIRNEDAREIVRLCGQCPLVIKIMGDYLSRPDIEPMNVIDRLKSRGSSFGEEQITGCLNESFLVLSGICQEALIHLSVFETSFDWYMAEAVMKKPAERVEDILNQLRNHHLLEVETSYEAEFETVDFSLHLPSDEELSDDETFFRTNSAHKFPRMMSLGPKRQKSFIISQEDYSYTFHPVVLRFLQQKSSEDPVNYEKAKNDAEERYCAYFYKYIKTKLGSQLDRNSISACKYIHENSVLLIRFFDLLKEKQYNLQADTLEDVRCLFHLSKVRSYVGTRFNQADFYHTLAEQKQEAGDELFVFYARIHELISEKILDNVRGVKKLRSNLKTMLPRIKDGQQGRPVFKNLALADYHNLMGQDALDVARYEDSQVSSKPRLLKALEHFRNAQSLYPKEEYVWPEMARVTNCIGCVHFQLEEFEEARRYHQEALEQMKKNLGQEEIHGDIPNYLVNIGAVYHSIATRKPDPHEADRLYHKALDYYREATDIDKKLGFPDELVEARRLRNMADIYRRLKEFTEAYRSAHKAFRIFQDHFQPPHVELTTTLHLLGFIQYYKGKHLKQLANNELTDEAENAFKKAEKIYDDVAHMMKYGGLSTKHQDYRYVRNTHESVMEALRDQSGLRRVRGFYRDLESGKYDRKIDNVQRLIAGESSGSDMDSEEEEVEEVELWGMEAGLAVGGAGGAVHRQDSGFDGSIDLDIPPHQHDHPGFSSEEEEVFHADS